MKKYKIIIFDLDDTLIDNTENVRHAYAKMIKSVGESYTETGFQRWYSIDHKFWEDWQEGLIELPENLKNKTGKKSETFLNWLRAQRILIYFNHQISLEKAIELNYLYMNALKENVIAINNAYNTLQYLSNKYQIIIATNGPQIATKEKLSKINCLQFVNNILSADMFGYVKPRKEFFEGIKHTLSNHNTEEYLIIGDSLTSDIAFAMNCNFDSCWFNPNNATLPIKYKPTIIINDLIELTKKL